MTDRFNVYVFVVEYFMREAPSSCLAVFFVLQLNYTTSCWFVPLFLEFPYNTNESSHPKAEGIENAQGKKEGIGNKPT